MSFEPYFLFLAVWKRLARKGACDDAGGAEFRRVFREWIGAGHPLPVAHFIRNRANIPAGDVKADIDPPVESAAQAEAIRNSAFFHLN
jgi:hypothetical protein